MSKRKIIDNNNYLITYDVVPEEFDYGAYMITKKSVRDVMGSRKPYSGESVSDTIYRLVSIEELAVDLSNYYKDIVIKDVQRRFKGLSSEECELIAEDTIRGSFEGVKEDIRLFLKHMHISYTEIIDYRSEQLIRNCPQIALTEVIKLGADDLC